MKQSHYFTLILSGIFIIGVALFLQLFPVKADIQPTIPQLISINKQVADSICSPEDKPKHVGIQVGHWKNEELPDELEKLRTNEGAVIPGKQEWEVAYSIATVVKATLEAQGYTVDLLPATIPPGYCAQAFVAIHLDASPDIHRTGYKAATYWDDQTGLGSQLVQYLETAYRSVGLDYDPTITSNMRGYYAFNSQRFAHAISPNTPGVIFETGYLTNPSDANILINKTELPGKALAEGIINFLNREKG